MIILGYPSIPSCIVHKEDEARRGQILLSQGLSRALGLQAAEHCDWL